MPNIYEEEIYIEEIDDYVLCQFEYHIIPGQKAITSGPPERCQPGFDPEVEILSAESMEEEYFTEDEILNLVTGGEEGIRERILIHDSEKHSY